MTTMKFFGLVMCLIGVSGHMWKKFTNSEIIENRYGIVDTEDDNKHLTLPENVYDDSDDSNSSTEVLFDILNKRYS